MVSLSIASPFPTVPLRQWLTNPAAWARWALAAMCLSGVSKANANLSLDSVRQGLNAAIQNTPQIMGKTVVTTTNVGIPDVSPDRPVILSSQFAGSYQWLWSSKDWVIEKKTRDVSPGTPPGTRLRIIRPHGDSILNYEDLLEDDGSIEFMIGHLDGRRDETFACPEIGHVWTKGTIDSLLGQIASPKITQSEGLIHVNGRYYSQNVLITLDPSQSFLAKEVSFVTAHGSMGYRIDRTALVGGVWLPEHAISWSGLSQGEDIVKGSTSTIQFSDFKVYQGKGWPTSVPPMAETAVIGSDENRLYRVGPKGELVYWGEQGKRIGRSSLGWGSPFILSGACLLLWCLWQLIFGKNGPRPQQS